MILSRVAVVGPLASLGLMLTICPALNAAELPVKTGETIVFLGDSITAEGGYPYGYINLTVAGLKANGIEVAPIGAGNAGETAGAMLTRLDAHKLLAPDRKHDWLTVSCGVNDVWHGQVSLEAFRSNATAIVDQALAAKTKVMILTATIIGEDLGNANNQKLAAYNDFLRALAKEKGTLLADLNADCQQIIKASPKPGGALTRDGVHMFPAGNQVMARGVLRAFGLNEAQITKAEEAWMDLPQLEYGLAVGGSIRISPRQQKRLEEIAVQHKLVVNPGVSMQPWDWASQFARDPRLSRLVSQMLQILNGMELAGNESTATAAELEKVFDDPARMAEALAKKEQRLNKRLDVLTR